VRIVPFRGEYYDLAPSARHLVRGLIYPVPDPALPFLGVHFTTRIDGTVEAGPNAVLAFRREGYRRGSFRLGDAVDIASWPGFWKMARRNLGTGIAEARRSWSKAAFVRDLQSLVPAVQASDLERGGAGVRAQAVDRSGKLLDDFALVESERSLHVLNAPSPAATASLSIAREIVSRAAQAFGLKA
jgi:L-2-hydroxyglutarate oxidase